MQEEKEEVTEEVIEEVAEVVSEEDKEKQEAQSKLDKRFGKLTGQKFAFKKEAEDARAENAALRKQLQELEQGQKREVEEDDFESREAYISHLVAEQIKASQEENRKSTAQKTAKDREEEEFNEMVTSFQESSNTAKEKYRDFSVVTANLPIDAKSDLGEAIMSAKENSGELLYHLGKNPELLDDFLDMSGRKLFREMGKLEVKIAALQSKQKSQAPDPINPTGNITNTGKPISKDPYVFNEFMERVNKLG